MPRPSLLPRSLTLQEVILSDTSGRFKLIGQGNTIRVLLNRRGQNSVSAEYEEGWTTITGRRPHSMERLNVSPENRDLHITGELTVFNFSIY